MADSKNASRESREVEGISDETSKEITELTEKAKRLGEGDFRAYSKQTTGGGASIKSSSSKKDNSDITITITADVGEAITGFKALSRELREATKAARELESAYKDAERAVNSDKIASINDMRDVQGQSGNYDYSPYMRGLYSGLELASATLEGREPEYKESPEKGVYLDGKKVGEATAPDLFDLSTKDAEITRYDLSEVPTEELHEELAKRDGVEEYIVEPHGCMAKLSFDYFTHGTIEQIEGVALILVNKG